MADCIIFNAYLINDAVSFEQLNHALYIENGYFRNFRQECPISVMPPTKTNRKKKKKKKKLRTHIPMLASL